MKTSFLSLVFCAFACLGFSFTPLPDSGDKGGRKIVERILDARHLVFKRGLKPTVITFEAAPGDSLRFDCPGCLPYLRGDIGGTTLSMSIIDSEGRQVLTEADLSRPWIKLNSPNGKFGLAIGHSGIGEKYAQIKQIRLFRKTSQVPDPEASGASTVMKIDHLYLGQNPGDKMEANPTFWLRMEKEDRILVKVHGPHKADVICQQYLKGEPFAKAIVTPDTPVAIPTSSGRVAMVGYEFSEHRSARGEGIYDIDLQRIE
jgi:hypothetical protein